MEILSPATIWMELKGIMLSKMSVKSQMSVKKSMLSKKSNIIWTYLYVESKKQNIKLIDTESRLVLARGEGIGCV